MTKSLPSAIKLRLSRLVRCLIALGCLKLAIMGVALFDLPMPSWSGGDQMAEGIKHPVEEKAPVSPAPIADDQLASADATDVQADVPVGSTAVDLATLSKPRNPAAFSNAILPAPLINDGPKTATAPGAFTPRLPTPPSPGLPLAKAGVILPRAQEPMKKDETGVWDMLNLTSLPIPGLGSAAVARAAALDMPVPNTPPARSPFTPAEQLAGGGSSASLPVPAAPARQDNTWIPDPHNSPTDAPAPAIAPRASSLDPNIKTQELARQQQDMLMLRQQMDQRLKDLQTAEDKMKEMLKEATNIEEQKVRGLIQMYSNMKPRMAAQAMEKMDERVAVRILSGMPPKQSGEILTYTNPAKTAKFTEMMTRLKMQQ